MKTTKKLLTLVLAIAISCAAFADIPKKKPKFGSIETKDLKMTTYEKDTTAPAVYLMDYGRAFFADQGGLKLYFERHFRIKILNKDGYNWADTEIRRHYKSNLQRVKAATYNLENGEIVTSELDKKEIFTEETSKTRRTDKFKMPDVKVGSIIEISYKVEAGSIYRLVPWTFQHDIPAILSYFVVDMPDMLNYKTLMTGELSLTFTDQKNISSALGPGLKKTWALEHSPALKSEPFVSTVNNYRSVLRFELASIESSRGTQNYSADWESIAKKMMEYDDVGELFDKGKMFDDEVNMLISGKETDEEKVEAIVNYIKDKIEWNNRFSYWNGEYNIKKVISDGAGTSGEINIILIMMLRQAGFNVHPVFLSTRKNGVINQYYPNDSKFNYVVAAVKMGDGRVLVDATDKMRPWNELPFYCLNGEGFMVSDKTLAFEWIPVMNKEKFVRNTQITLHFEDEELVGNVVDSRSYQSAYNMRSKIKDKGETEYRDEFTEEHANLNITNLELVDLENRSGPLKESYEVRVSDDLQVAGNLIYFNPLLVHREEENPFNTDIRKFPIDFGCPFTEMVMVSVDIPEGYVVDEQPESVAVGLPEKAGSFRYSVNVANGKIVIISKITMNKHFFNSDFNQYFKQFYDQIVSKQSEQFVLKKQS